jgi:hypothetical protein
MLSSLARRAHPESTRRVGLRLLSVALVAAFVGCVGAQAQEKKAAPVPQEKKAAPAPAPLAVVRQVVPDEQFEQWVFQQGRNPQDRNASGARKRLDSVLALQVEAIDRACKLTDAQKKKMQLAGRGDIKRFFDRYEKVKQKFLLIRHDEQKMQEIWQDISPLQMTLQASFFHEDSLLFKSLNNTLTGEQFARYDAIARERRAFGHRANIELAVTMIEQGMPLRDAQRREFITLLTNETKPPRKPGQYDYHFIMYQLGRLPEAKLKPLFDEAQWKVVNRQVAQFKGLEPLLRQAGLWPVEDDEADRTDAQPAALKK